MLIPKEVFNLHKLTDNSSRCALGGVKFERDDAGRPVAVATDGYRLMAMQWAEDGAERYPAHVANAAAAENFSAIVPADACKKAARFKTAKAALTKNQPFLGHVVLDETASDNQAVTLAATNLESVDKICPQPLDGRYPRWRDVVPQYNAGEAVSVAINGDYLAELAAVMSQFAADDKTKNGLVLTVPTEPGRPALLSVEREDGRRAVAVLMPLYNKQMPSEPCWLAAGAMSAAEAAAVKAAATEAEQPEPQPAEAPAAVEPEPVAEPQPRREPAAVAYRRVRRTTPQPATVDRLVGDAKPTEDDPHAWARAAARVYV